MKYYLYNRANKNFKFLFSSKPKLDKYSFFPMHPVIIKSRDGLDLISYVTVPTNAKLQNSSNKPSPLVLLVHGGPWNRNSFGFNTLHQWLANRGYAVLSVNFRGSSGFGKKFLNAGNMEWGNKMQDDLIDAVNWAIENKIAQADKICIMGSSYGGYAVLSALAHTPDVFACGIDIVGPSNLLTLLSSLPKSWLTKSGIYKMLIGPWETEEDKKFLKDRSPLFFASQIKKPLLIAHGANDPRVKITESNQIVSALNKHGIPVIYIVYKNEGHGFTCPENRLSFYAQAEKFLSDILEGKLQPIK